MLFVAGFTMSLDFPVLHPIDQPVLFSNGYYYEDVFVTKVDPWDGTVVYSTTLGGPGTDIAYALAVAADGSAYVAGRAGPEFPYTRMLGKGCQESPRTAFVLKLNADGDGVEWAACLCAGAYATALSLGDDGSVYAAGFYEGAAGADPGLPVTEGVFQTAMPPSHRGKTFVVRLTPEGEPVFATWLGGNGEDRPAALAALPGGEVVVASNTTSNNFPTVNALQPRNSSGGGVSWSGDGGRTWEPRNAGLDYNAMTQVAADPFVSGAAYASSLPLGVMKTVDFGASWRAVNQGIPLTPSPNVQRVVPSKAAPGLLYAIAAGLLLRSADGGEHWTGVPLKVQPLGVWPHPKNRDSAAVLVAAPPSGPSGQPEFQLLRTEDGGASWPRLAAGLTLTSASQLFFDETRDGVLFLLNDGYFRSEDRGATWTALAPLPARPGLQGLALDPRQPGVLYADVLLSTPAGAAGRLARSADDGRSWTLCGDFPEQALSFWVDAADSSVVFVMTRLAVHRSSDACATFAPAGKGLPGRTLLAATQDSAAPENLYVAASPASDVFVARLSADGRTAAFSTYLGTREADSAAAVAADAEGGVWLTGATPSEDWPVTETAAFPHKAAREDGFLTLIAPAGEAIAHSTYIGGNGSDSVLALALDSGGAVWLAGLTRSTDFPSNNSFQDSYRGGAADSFLLCFDSGELAFSTLLGGSGNDWLAALRVNASGRILAAGTTSSVDWPVSPQAAQPAHSGGNAEDAVVVLLSRGGLEGISAAGGGRPSEEDPRPPPGRPRTPLSPHRR